MHFHVDKEDPALNKWPEPSLKEMTEKAMDILQKNEDGYFLLVEGSVPK